MDSINRNQPEHNRQDLSGQAAVKRIKQVAEKAETCFFRSTAATGESSGVRPMTVLEVDEEGSFWFFSAGDSHLNRDVGLDPKVELFFQGSTHSDFLYLAGRAKISRDAARIEKLWQPLFKTWFTEGKDDPRITVLKVTPNEGYYWDNKHGNLVAGAKMFVGAMIGKTLDDSIEGKVRV